MKAVEHDLLRRVEDRHWWHRVLRTQVLSVVEDKLKSPSRLLDAGCGTGGMLQQLKRWGGDLEMQGIDVSERAVRHCHERGVPAVQGTLHDLPFESASFDMVLCLDVLYHKDIEEDRALVEMNRVLKVGGWLILNLPALNCLRGSHDEAVQGARRYHPGRLQGLIHRHGFVCEHTQFWNAWAFFPMLIWRRLSRRRGGVFLRSDLALPPACLNNLLHRLGILDAWVCRKLRIPWGSSLFTVARKTSQLVKGGLA